jgi:hypothetical protein
LVALPEYTRIDAGAFMSDEDFLRALESCELPEEEFGHAAHVRAAYLYLRARDFATALGRTRRSIRTYAAHLGKPERYNETITVAYVALIQQHMWERGDGGAWAAFARDNPELLDKALLRVFYPSEQLDSAAAREIFLLPRAGIARTNECA